MGFSLILAMLLLFLKKPASQTKKMLFVLGFVGSMLAGIINTFAGNGSSITLYLLMEVFGLPPNVANATNRIGIFSQGAVSMPALWRKGHPDIRNNGWILACVILGAIGGLITALQVDNAVFRSVFKYMILLMLVVILVKPQRWINPKPLEEGKGWPKWLLVPVFLILGFYGGFIQLGMGLFYLMVVVLGLRQNLVEGNAGKIAATTIYTGIAILTFWQNNWIDWYWGLIFAAGQASGGWLAVRFLTSKPSASIWAYRILVVVVVGAVVRLFLS